MKNKIGNGHCFLDFISYTLDLIGQYGIDITYDEVIRRYSEPHRHFHTVEHLNDVLKQLVLKRSQLLSDNKRSQRSSDNYVSMLIAAIFHDIVYDPQRRDNEEKSIEFLDFSTSILDESEYYEIKENAKKIILATKTHDKIHELIYSFNKIDCSILDRSLPELLKWEEQIHKEYEFTGSEYKERRLKFLKLSIPEHMGNVNNLNKLIEYVEKSYLS